MEGRARAVAVVALLAAFGVGVCLLGTCLVGCGKSGPPADQQAKQAQQKVERIGEKSLELETLTVAEWNARGDRAGKFKNAKGECTMVLPMKCAACGAKIPQGPTAESAAETDELRKACKCPKCGKCPYPGLE